MKNCANSAREKCVEFEANYAQLEVRDKVHFAQLDQQEGRGSTPLSHSANPPTCQARKAEVATEKAKKAAEQDDERRERIAQHQAQGGEIKSPVVNEIKSPVVNEQDEGEPEQVH